MLPGTGTVSPSSPPPRSRDVSGGSPGLVGRDAQRSESRPGARSPARVATTPGERADGEKVGGRPRGPRCPRRWGETPRSCRDSALRNGPQSSRGCSRRGAGARRENPGGRPVASLGLELGDNGDGGAGGIGGARPDRCTGKVGDMAGVALAVGRRPSRLWWRERKRVAPPAFPPARPPLDPESPRAGRAHVRRYGPWSARAINGRCPRAATKPSISSSMRAPIPCGSAART